MNTPETINIEKYAEALNNLIGVDSAYMAGDKDVDAIVEVIVAAKKLENKIKALTEENERLRTDIVGQLEAEVYSSDKYIDEYDGSEVQKAYNKGLRDALKIAKEMLEENK